MTFSFKASENGFVHVCGHRGHMLGAPENTEAAIRATHEHGGTTAEIDTVLTADDAIIVLHDQTVDRTTDRTGVVGHLTLEEIARCDAGSWFGEDHFGERVPTLRQALDLARALDMGFEVEIKEKRRLGPYIEALAALMTDAEDRARAMMISFDHASLRAVKQAIPGIRTGGIVHARYGDPVAVARSADLDQLCIDLDVFHPDDARALHEAGISIRCHAYSPQRIERAEQIGLDYRRKLTDWLREGLIDTLSGDDVSWVRALVDEAFANRTGRPTVA